jgi:hypothetical protein
VALPALPETSTSVALLNSGDDADQQNDDEDNDPDSVNGVFHVDPA